MMKAKIKQIIIDAVFVGVIAIISANYGARIALDRFDQNHSTITIQENDAEYLRTETQKKIWGD